MSFLRWHIRLEILELDGADPNVKTRVKAESRPQTARAVKTVVVS